jgi:hypothetical protein
VQVVGGAVRAEHVESGPAQIGLNRRFGEVVGVVDLHRLLDRPVAEVRRAEIDDVHEEDPFGHDQAPHGTERAGDVEQVIHRLAHRDDVKAFAARVELLHEARDGPEPQSTGLRNLERRGVDDGAGQAEPGAEGVRDDAGRSSDVEEAAKTPAAHEWLDQVAPLHGIVPLLGLNRRGIDHPAVVRADERPVRVDIEALVRLCRHHRVEEHQPASAATRRLRREPVAIPVGQDDPSRPTAQIAHLHGTLGPGAVVVTEGRNSPLPGLKHVAHISTSAVSRS